MSRVWIVMLAALISACAATKDTTTSTDTTTSKETKASKETTGTAASSDLPPLPSVPFPFARPTPIVQAVFAFAAQHPEVLGKIPCFCGCQNRGHQNNDDCFVAARDAGGRVTAWEPHGLG